MAELYTNKSLLGRIANWSKLSESDRSRLLERPAVSQSQDIGRRVAAIVDDVRIGGDQALRKYTLELDGYSGDSLAVTEDEWERALTKVSAAEWAALKRAADQIRRFHAAEMPQPLRVEVSPGIVCQRLWRPIERVGLYVPAGTAPLPSTLLMLAIPAELAGCSERIVVTPVGASGTPHPGILAAARLAGVSAIFKVGGAQAIAALAYGTASVPKVDKIFGPGNAYVTCAKSLVSLDPRGAAADLPAGPSEVLVVADAKADPNFIAADLLSQAEHGRDSQVVLVTTSETVATATLGSLERQLAKLTRREIASESLAKSLIIVVGSTDEALDVANAYAPEHLILQIQDAARFVSKIKHAGSVFVGPWSPESVGDYASGTNHVLPTYGLARGHGGLSIESFMKSMTVQELSPGGLRDIGPTVETLAVMEGLDAHAAA
ncbi:MAG: hypothetical protein RL011_707, partial [Pseudomonadota bacterium]